MVAHGHVLWFAIAPRQLEGGRRLGLALGWLSWMGWLGELPWLARPLCVRVRSVLFLRGMCSTSMRWLQLLLVSLRTPYEGPWAG